MMDIMSPAGRVQDGNKKIEDSTPIEDRRALLGAKETKPATSFTLHLKLTNKCLKTDANCRSKCKHTKVSFRWHIFKRQEDQGIEKVFPAHRSKQAHWQSNVLDI